MDAIESGQCCGRDFSPVSGVCRSCMSSVSSQREFVSFGLATAPDGTAESRNFATPTQDTYPRYNLRYAYPRYVWRNAYPRWNGGRSYWGGGRYVRPYGRAAWTSGRGSYGARMVGRATGADSSLATPGFLSARKGDNFERAASLRTMIDRRLQRPNHDRHRFEATRAPQGGMSA